MNKFSQLVEDHRLVIHGQEPLGHVGRCEGISREYPLRDIQGHYDRTCRVCHEERGVSKMSANVLLSVCKECFSPAIIG